MFGAPWRRAFATVASARKFNALATRPLALKTVGPKSVAQPSNTPTVERDDIEPAHTLRIGTLRQKILRGTHDPALLLASDAGDRTAITAAGPRTHFDENEYAIRLAHDEVDLATAAREIARDETQPLAQQKLEGETFEYAPKPLRLAAPAKVVRTCTCTCTSACSGTRTCTYTLTSIPTASAAFITARMAQ